MLNRRGELVSDCENSSIKYISIKGRKEMKKQRLFKCQMQKIELELKFAGERHNEIKEELQELEDYSDDEDKVQTKKS